MELIAAVANGFIELFKAGAATFVGWVANIIPLVVVLMTAVSACIKLIGEEKVYSMAGILTKSIFTRYTLLPIISVLFLANPMCYTFGRFVQEKHKPAFYDATVSFLHPVTGLFPHANGGELFVYMGIATGITTLGLPLGDLAVRYFIVGIIVIFLRGVITERIYAVMRGRK
ncbi:MAG TPA: PTS glucitol/sorbitol transporter subunit IIC [Megamonas hypermegale]|uniref:PTS glucitol/sorbitol transporter subunit IIC n=1 Tax=Megamonas hypermegale TaxID=158847 RepID=A0A921HKG4_9FIRM|nr:PTS glucitol/sorbitol transporter subunit IIC [Megamonas hypermegale]MDM8144016.1 PTS glucitol/sorbitol transporter subunit IIC [Megamonas hypermegale]HJF84095.1 PTS glucitol/sorbitol transporter subunit IIC [Megamonas hypermegale]